MSSIDNEETTEQNTQPEPDLENQIQSNDSGNDDLSEVDTSEHDVTEAITTDDEGNDDLPEFDTSPPGVTEAITTDDNTNNPIKIKETRELGITEPREHAYYEKHKQIKAAMGIKVSAQNLDTAVAGTNVLVYREKEGDNLEELKETVVLLKV